MIAARGLRRFGRGLLLTGVAVLLHLGGVACGGSGGGGGDGGGSDDTISGSELRISGSELGELPAIAVVAGDPRHTAATAAGNLYLTSGDRSTLTLLKSWPESLTDGVAYGVFRANWSPDRKRLGVSIASWDGDPYARLAVMTLAGRAMRTITEPSGDFLISWSADGRRLLYEDFFHSDREGIWSIPVAPGAEEGRIHLSATGRLLKRGGRSFRLAPEGSSIAAEFDGGILVLDLDSGAVRQLTHGDDWLAGWSPDSRSILFNRSRPAPDDDMSDVYAIDADGTDLRQLTSDGAAQAMDWSPDGALVLFLRSAASDAKRPNKQVWELWVMDADGGRQTRLPFNRPQLEVVAADWST